MKIENIAMLAGLGLAAYVAFSYFSRQQVAPDLSQVGGGGAGGGGGTKPDAAKAGDMVYNIYTSGAPQSGITDAQAVVQGTQVVQQATLPAAITLAKSGGSSRLGSGGYFITPQQTQTFAAAAGLTPAQQAAGTAISTQFAYVTAHPEMNFSSLQFSPMK